jgi:hypothetical protein
MPFFSFLYIHRSKTKSATKFRGPVRKIIKSRTVLRWNGAASRERCLKPPLQFSRAQSIPGASSRILCYGNCEIDNLGNWEEVGELHQSLVARVGTCIGSRYRRMRGWVAWLRERVEWQKNWENRWTISAWLEGIVECFAKVSIDCRWSCRSFIQGVQ